MNEELSAKVQKVISSLKAEEILAYSKQYTAIKKQVMHGDVPENEVKFQSLSLKLILFEASRQNFIAKNYDMTERQLKLILDLNPMDAKAHNNLSMVYYEMERYDLAEKKAIEALEYAPEWGEALNTLFIAQEAQEKYYEILQRSIKFHPKESQNVCLNTWYGIALKGLKNFNESIEILQDILSKDADYYPAEAALAEAYLDSEQYDRAIRECKKILKKYPKNRGIFIDALQIMGNVFGRQEKYILAGVAYKNVLRLDPNSHYAGYNYLYSLHKQGFYSKEFLDSYEKDADKILKIWRLEDEMFNLGK